MCCRAHVEATASLLRGGVMASVGLEKGRGLAGVQARGASAAGGELAQQGGSFAQRGGNLAQWQVSVIANEFLEPQRPGGQGRRTLGGTLGEKRNGFGSCGSLRGVGEASLAAEEAWWAVEGA